MPRGRPRKTPIPTPPPDAPLPPLAPPPAPPPREKRMSSKAGTFPPRITAAQATGPARAALEALAEVEDALARGNRALGAHLAAVHAEADYRARLMQLGEAVLTLHANGVPLPPGLRMLLQDTEQLRLGTSAARDAAVSLATQAAEETPDVLFTDKLP